MVAMDKIAIQMNRKKTQPTYFLDYKPKFDPNGGILSREESESSQNIQIQIRDNIRQLQSPFSQSQRDVFRI